MKVIKHGSKYVIQKERTTCEVCGCVFEFTQADCDSKTKVVDKGTDKEIDFTQMFMDMLTSKSNYGTRKTFCITCPECKSKFDLRDDIFIDLTEEWKKYDSAETER